MPRKITPSPDELPDEARLARGRARGKEARFTAAPAKAEMPGDYAATLKQIKDSLAQARLRTLVATNVSFISSYWQIGAIILTRQKNEGWGAKVIDRLSADLREAFPDMSGLSPRNLKYMRAFAVAWPDQAIVQRSIAQLPWRHNIALLDKLADTPTRLWYAEAAARHGWSQAVLIHQIEARQHLRQGKAQHNFPSTLPPADSDLATQIFKDPYLFDFVGTDGSRREKELEAGLVAHIQHFLLELGTGFAFIGRQVHLEVGDQDFFLDLLFYHTRLRRHVVVELKAGRFAPEHLGQMNLYLAAVDDLLKHPDDQPSIGLLLCKSRDKVVVEYALRGVASPIGVANWTTELTASLPADLAPSLPSIAQIEAELAAASPPKPKRKPRTP